MANNKHVFLSNATSSQDNWKKGRNVKGKEEDDETVDNAEPVIISEQRKAFLRGAVRQYDRDLAARRQEKSIDHLKETELLIVRLTKRLEKSLRDDFNENYGLNPINSEDLDRTILFEFSDVRKRNVFFDHLNQLINLNQGESHNGRAFSKLALVTGFEFLTKSKRIISSIQDNGTAILNLVPSADEDAFAELTVALSEYFHGEGLSATFISGYLLEVQNISPAQQRFIAQNFDLVSTISSIRAAVRGPGAYGQRALSYGFELQVEEDLPVVGVIDTGVSISLNVIREAVLSPGIDLTSGGMAIIDNNGHGTQVAGIIILGNEFYKRPREGRLHRAKCKILPIKALENGNDSLEPSRIVDAIVRAKREFGVRLFNLSLNTPFPKRYNSKYSTFAYLLDRVAYEEDVLIFISTGNIASDYLEEVVLEDDPNHQYPAFFYNPTGNSPLHFCELTNLQEPAESLNNISVGALAGNLEDDAPLDISPSQDHPAFYTRKHHLDVDRQVNGGRILKSQRESKLQKPDLVFEGGDLFNVLSGIEVLNNSFPGSDFYVRSSGTSLATPFIASLAAEIMKEYPRLMTQSIKALLINCAASPCGANPLLFRESHEKTFKKLMGKGKPDSQKALVTDDNAITLVIEKNIACDEFITMPIYLPSNLNVASNKLYFTGTLCYSFLPIGESHLAYLPLHISFGIFKNTEIAHLANKTEGNQVRGGVSWSEDHFGIDNRIMSNVQKVSFGLKQNQINENDNTVTLAVRCRCKEDIPEEHLRYLMGGRHNFSIVLTIEEHPHLRAGNNLYGQMIVQNTIEQIVEIEIDGLEAEGEL